jgi:hypothetical protein
MEKSSSIQNIAKALITFHVKVEKIKKDATNPFFHSKYASLSNILEAIQTPLLESGLAFTQLPSGEDGMITLLMHAESGEYIQSDYIVKPVKSDPQSKGSAITYQRRYALCSVLGLNIEEDDDGNAATGNTYQKQAKNGSANDLPWLNEGTKEYDGAVVKLKAGTTTIDKIKTVMKISKTTETKLKAFEKPITA